MRFSVGFLDSMFGEKIVLDLPGSEGTFIKRKVSKKWLKKMKSEGQIKDINAIRVHMIDPLKGYTLGHWVIGEDIDEDKVNKFRDTNTGDLYAMTHYENGELKVSVMTKSLWDRTKELMDSI